MKVIFIQKCQLQNILAKHIQYMGLSYIGTVTENTKCSE